MAIPRVDADAAAGFEILPDFERFDQKNDVFRRSWWDPRIRDARSELFYKTYRDVLDHWRSAEGFTQRDYALRNASWHVSDLFTEYHQGQDRREGFTDEFTLNRASASTQIAFESPAAAAREIKHIAKLFGADLVGITAYDERWTYTEKFSDARGESKPQELPANLTHVIVTAHAMDYDLMRTVPSALSGTATGLGYSRDAMTLLGVAQYIRNLGYHAVASLNDTALMIPYAIQAGLGEYGRHGLLITREFGPRVRLGKIFTDLPMTHDQPIHFGVRAFCNECRRCANACPVKAIPFGEPDAERVSESIIKGVRKWSVNPEKCFGYWKAQNSDCSICVRVCPYNKPYTHWHERAWRWLAGTRARRVALWLDDKLGYGARLKPNAWWQNRD